MGLVKLLLFTLTLRWSVGVSPDEKRRHLGMTKQTLDQILNNYDAYSRPEPPDGADHTSIIVHANMYIARAHFDGADATLEVTYREEWEDGRLKFSPFVNHISLPPGRSIWKPDTFFATAQEMKKSAEMQFVRVEPEGIVSTSQRYTLKLDCKPSSSAYPLYNHISCLIKIGSYGYTMDDIVYFWRRHKPIVYNKADGAFQQYHMHEPQTDKCDANVSTGSYSCIQVELIFSAGLRESLLYFYLPTLLLLLCSWLHFWIHGSWTVPRTASALAPFVVFVCCLLFLRHPATVFLSAWDVWMLFCTLLSFFSLLEYFCCICIGVRRSQPSTADSEKPLLEEGAKPARCAGKGGATGLDYTARTAFPIATLIFIVLYLVFFLLF